MFSVPSRILLVRDLCLHNVFGFFRMINLMKERLLCVKQHWYTLLLLNVMVRFGLPVLEILTTMLFQCLRRLLPVVSLILPMRLSHPETGGTTR